MIYQRRSCRICPRIYELIREPALPCAYRTQRRGKNAAQSWMRMRRPPCNFASAAAAAAQEQQRRRKQWQTRWPLMSHSNYLRYVMRLSSTSPLLLLLLQLLMLHAVAMARIAPLTFFLYTVDTGHCHSGHSGVEPRTPPPPGVNELPCWKQFPADISSCCDQRILQRTDRERTAVVYSTEL